MNFDSSFLFQSIALQMLTVNQILHTLFARRQLKEAQRFVRNLNLVTTTVRLINFALQKISVRRRRKKGCSVYPMQTALSQTRFAKNRPQQGRRLARKTRNANLSVIKENSVELLTTVRMVFTLLFHYNSIPLIFSHLCH